MGPTWDQMKKRAVPSAVCLPIQWMRLGSGIRILRRKPPGSNGVHPDRFLEACRGVGRPDRLVSAVGHGTRPTL